MALDICRFPLFLAAWLSSLWTRFVLLVLSAGPIPNHIAFIMDGNRRYARRKGEPVSSGHDQGSQALRRILELCIRLRVPCVSVYAFAIENFKRSPDEVDALMSLVKEKLLEIAQHGDLLDQYGIRVAGIGKTSMLPADVLEVLTAVEKMTQNNNGGLLNLCMPYASRDEMTTAIESTVRSCLRGDLDPDYITEEDIEANLLTSKPGSPPVDILVRTSGVRRLSDYFLWQCCEDTQIHFIETLWPAFGLRDLVPIILDYQKRQWSR